MAAEADGSAATASIDGVVIDVPLVRALVDEQLPHWRDLPLRPVPASGNDHRMFRLGDALCVRLPSAPGYVPQGEKERAVLPRLAATVPLPIPAVHAVGEPSSRFPAPWSVLGWIDGEPATAARLDDQHALADDLAHFLVALRGADIVGGPGPGLHSGYRGAPVAHWDDEVAQLLERVDGRDRAVAAAVWRDALGAPPEAVPSWFHGDVASGNLLVRDGRLAAVIDFGCAGVGDPACDAVIAWTLLDEGPSARFRATLGADDAEWARGRGWAVWKALIQLGSDHPAEARLGRRVLDRLGAER